MGGFALLLRWLTWWQALALAAGASPSISSCCRWSPAACIAPAIDAAAPARHPLLSARGADAAALLSAPARHRRRRVGHSGDRRRPGDARRTRGRRPRWPWNRDKTVAGALAFVAGGRRGGVFLAWWCRPDATASRARGLPRSAVADRGGAGGGARSRPSRSASTTISRSPSPRAPRCGSASLIDVARLSAWRWHGRRACRLPLRSWRTRWSPAPGTARERSRCRAPSSARIIGTIIFASLGWQGWMLLLADIRCRVGRVAARPATQDAARHRRGARRTTGSGQRDREHRRRGDRARCWRWLTPSAGCRAAGVRGRAGGRRAAIRSPARSARPGAGGRGRSRR